MRPLPGTLYGRIQPQDLALGGIGASFLEAHTDLVELWLAWSEDKRSTPSPFFRRSGSRYELGYVEQGGRFRPSEFFDQPARPCARFILQELAV